MSGNSNLFSGDITQHAGTGIYGIYGDTINIHESKSEEVGGPTRQELLRWLSPRSPRRDLRRILSLRARIADSSVKWFHEHPAMTGWLTSSPANYKTKGLILSGAPGSGKSVLVASLVKWLAGAPHSLPYKVVIAYSFCQSSSGQLLPASTVLRGLMASVLESGAQHTQDFQRHLMSVSDFPAALPDDFDDMADIFCDCLESIPHEHAILLIIDGLDECDSMGKDLLRLLGMIDRVYDSRQLRWLVSCRPSPEVRAALANAWPLPATVSLDHEKDNTSLAVDKYIEVSVTALTKMLEYSPAMASTLQQYLSLNADGNFLWVSLVLQELRHRPLLENESASHNYPAGLDSIYNSMLRNMQHQAIHWSASTTTACYRLLRFVCLALEPVRAQDALTLCGFAPSATKVPEVGADLVQRCGSFLNVNEHSLVAFAHKSAKDYFTSGEGTEIFTQHGVRSTAEAQQQVALGCLQVLQDTLRLPLAVRYQDWPATRPFRSQAIFVRNKLSGAPSYASQYWLKHLLSATNNNSRWPDMSWLRSVSDFLANRFLLWLEMQTWLDCLSKTRADLHRFYVNLRLEYLTTTSVELLLLMRLTRDILEFLVRSYFIVHKSPAQIYIGALTVCQTIPSVRRMRTKLAPKWLDVQACNFYEGTHCNSAVVVAPDRQFILALGLGRYPDMRNVRNSGTLPLADPPKTTLSISTAMVSPDSATAAIRSTERFVTTWDLHTGHLRWSHAVSKTSKTVGLAFSHDSQLLAISQEGVELEVIRVSNGERDDSQLHSSAAPSKLISIAFAEDSPLLACGTHDGRLMVLHQDTGALSLQKVGDRPVTFVSFNKDGGALCGISGDIPFLLRVRSVLDISTKDTALDVSPLAKSLELPLSPLRLQFSKVSASESPGMHPNLIYGKPRQLLSPSDELLLCSTSEGIEMWRVLPDEGRVDCLPPLRSSLDLNSDILWQLLCSQLSSSALFQYEGSREAEFKPDIDLDKSREWLVFHGTKAIHLPAPVDHLLVVDKDNVVVASSQGSFISSFRLRADHIEEAFLRGNLTEQWMILADVSQDETSPASALFDYSSDSDKDDMTEDYGDDEVGKIDWWAGNLLPLQWEVDRNSSTLQHMTAGWFNVLGHGAESAPAQRLALSTYGSAAVFQSVPTSAGFRNRTDR